MAIDLKEIDFEKTPLPEIAEAVVSEVNKIGDNVKEKIDNLHIDYEEMKKLVDEKEKDTKAVEAKDIPGIDTLLTEKIAKYTEDISIKQADLDKRATEIISLDNQVKEFEKGMEGIQSKFNGRLDELEVAMQRPRGSADDGKSDEMEEAKQFFLANYVGKANHNGTKIPDNIEDVIDVDLEAFRAYKKVFGKYLRKYDEKAQALFSADEMKALMVATDPDGGYTVTPFMSNQIITRLYESDPIRQLCSVQSISTGSLEMMVDWDEAGAEWEGETTPTTDTTTPTWNKVKIPVHIMATRPRATQTLLDDSGVNIERWLANKVADKFARSEGAAFITGDGVNRPRGILTYNNGTNFGQIEQTNLGATATLVADGIIDVKYSLIEQYLNRASWIVNRLTVSELMQLKDGSGNYLWKPAQIAGDPTSTLLALPLRMSTTMPTVAADALALGLADWREAYLIVDRMGITVQRDPFTQKPFIEFYTRKRVGADVVNFQAIKIGKIAV